MSTPDKITVESDDECTCPYCNHQHSIEGYPDWAIKDGEWGYFKCDNCNKTYHMEVSITVSFAASKVSPCSKCGTPTVTHTITDGARLYTCRRCRTEDNTIQF